MLVADRCLAKELLFHRHYKADGGGGGAADIRAPGSTLDLTLAIRHILI